MTNRIPLIVNPGTGQIDELAAGDNLSLPLNNIVDVGNITASGNVVTGNIKTDGYYYANGVPVTFGGSGNYGNSNVVSLMANFGGSIIPAADNVYSLGSSTHQWAELWVSNNTIYIGGVPLGGGGNTLLYDGNPVVTVSNSPVSFNSDVSTSESLSGGNLIISNVGGGLTFGDGSVQTTALNYSNANVQAYLPTYSGDVDDLNVTGQLTAVTQANADSSSNVATTEFVQHVVTASGGYGDAQVEALLASGTVTTDIITSGELTGATGIIGSYSAPGDFFIRNDGSSVSLGQFAAQGITVGGSGIQIAGTGGVDIQGAAGATVTIGAGTSGNVIFPRGITFGDGSWQNTAAGGGSSYGDSNVEALLSGGSVTTDIITSGDVGAGALTVSGLTTVGDLYSTTFFSNAVTYANTSGYLVNTNQFTYDDSTGTLDVANVTASANVSATYFIGNGALLTGIATGGSYSNANVAAYLASNTDPTISAIEGNVATLSGDVTTLQGNVTTLEGNIATLEGNVATLDGQISTLQGNITTLEGNIATLEGNITTIDGQITTLQGNVATLEGNVASIESNVSVLQGNITTLEGNIATLEGNVTTIEGNIATLEGNVTSLTGDVTTLQGNIASIESNVTTLQGNVTSIESNVSILQGNVTTLEGNIATLEGNVTAIESNVSVLQGNVTTLEGNVSAIESNVTTLQGNVATLEGNVTSLTGDVTLINSNVTALTTALASTNSNVSSTNSNVSALTTALASTNSNVANNTSNITVLQGNVANIEANISTLQGQVYSNSNVSGFLPTYSGALGAANLSLGTGNLSLFGNVIRATSDDILIDPLGDGSTGGNVVILGNLSVTGNTYSTNPVIAVTNNLLWQAANNANTPLAASGAGLGVGPAGNGYAYLTYDAVSNVWNSTVGIHVSGDISTAGNVYSGYLYGDGSNISNLSANPSISSINSNVSNLSNALASTDSNVASNASNIAILQGNVATIEGNIATLEGNVTAIEGNITTLQGNVTTLEGNVSAIESNVTTLQGNVTTLEGNVASIEGNVATLQGNVTTLEGNVSAIESNVTTLQGNVATIDGQITTLQGNVATLEGNIATIDGQITTLQGNVATLEGNVTAIEGNVSDLQAAVTSLSGNVYSDANVTALLSSGTVTTNIETTANVSANNISVNTITVASSLVSSGASPAPLISGFQLSNIVGNVSLTGNIAANNLGNVSELDLNGNSSTYLSGNGTWTAISVGSDYGNANVAAFLPTYSGALGNVGVANTLGVLMGTPSQGNLISNAVSLTTATALTDGIALLNTVLGKLVPPAPPQFPASQSLSITGTAVYRMANITQVNNSGNSLTVAPGTSVTTLRSAAYGTSTISNAGPGDSGTVTARLNGAAAGNVTLNGSSNGTYGNLIISGNQDYHNINASIQAGFWSVFSSRLSGTAPAGWNDVAITDSAAGNTNSPSWYYDNSAPGAPTYSNTSFSIGTNSVSYTSTVPHYNSTTQFNIGFTVANVSGNTYPTSNTFVTGTAGGAFQAPVSVTYAGSSLGTNVIPSFASANVTTTTNIVTGFGASSGSPSVSVNNSYSSGLQSFAPGATILYKTGTAGSLSFLEESNIFVGGTIGSGVVGSVSRIVNPGSGDTPAYSGTEAAFNSTSGPLQTYDAAVVANVLSCNKTNYSTGYLPVGPNLSTQDNTQYFTFKFIAPSTSKFDVYITGTIAGLYVALPGSVIDTSSTLNGWTDASIAYAGAGVPGAGAGGNGSNGCAVGGTVPIGSAMTARRTTCTFGTASTSGSTNNEVYVRIKLTTGQTVTSLAIYPASN